MKARHLVLMAGAAFVAIACDELVTDPTFDTWCGDELCHWQLEVGDIQRVETWHPGDDGVELVGSPVALSQRLETRDRELTLRIVADLATSANVVVEIDVGDDGALDYANVIPAGPAWSTQSMTIQLPRNDARTRLRLHKRGSGKAGIGRMSLKSPSHVISGFFDDFVINNVCVNADGCLTRFCKKEPDASSGICSYCTADVDCASDQYCELEPAAPFSGGCLARPSADGCQRDADCPEGMICGADALNQVELSQLGSAARALLTEFGECKAPASVAVDFACRGDRECSSGICCTTEKRPVSLCVGERSRCSL